MKNHCKYCKCPVENLNLSIYHKCNGISSFIWDTVRDDKNYCYNKYKNIHINEFYQQIVFVEKTSNFNILSKFELKAQHILEVFFKNFFEDYFNKELSQFNKLSIFNSSFSDETGQILKNIISRLNAPDLDPEILNEAKNFMLDIYFLALAIKKFPEHTQKEFHYELTYCLDLFLYKEYMITYFQTNIEKRKELNNKINNENAELPTCAKKVINIERKYLLFYSDFDEIILYSIERGELLCCYKGISDLIKIDDYNYIGLNRKNEIVNLKIKNNLSDNSGSFEVSKLFKKLAMEIKKFEVLDKDKLICIDNLHNINLIINKNNDYIVYKTISSNYISENYLDEYIVVDKYNNQIVIFNHINSNQLIIDLYDFDLNVIKNNLIINEKSYIHAPLMLNKHIYIIFGRRTYLISSKYFEVVSKHKNIKYYANSNVFLFHNSNEIFIAYKGKYIFQYKFVNNEFICSNVFDLKDMYIELTEINNKGDYSIFIKEGRFYSVTYPKYYFRNNINEKYDYPLLQKVNYDFNKHNYSYSSENFYSSYGSYGYDNCFDNSLDEEEYKHSPIDIEYNPRKVIKKFKGVSKEDNHSYINDLTKFVDDNYDNNEKWTPSTKLGKLVKLGKFKTIEEIFNQCIPIKEHQIVDHIMNGNKTKLKKECVNIEIIKNKNKKDSKFKAIVIIGDSNGHIGLGIKVNKNLESSVKEAVIEAKINIIPIKRETYKINGCKNYTIKNKVEGKSGSVRVLLIPAPKGTGLMGPKEAKKLFEFAGIDNIILKSFGNTSNLENLLKAIYNGLVYKYQRYYI